MTSETLPAHRRAAPSSCSGSSAARSPRRPWSPIVTLDREGSGAVRLVDAARERARSRGCSWPPLRTRGSHTRGHARPGTTCQQVSPAAWSERRFTLSVARRCTTNHGSGGLGVKGSQVQILSARLGITPGQMLVLEPTQWGPNHALVRLTTVNDHHSSRRGVRALLIGRPRVSTTYSDSPSCSCVIRASSRIATRGGGSSWGEPVHKARVRNDQLRAVAGR
jgi:hypothetical protein